MILYMCFDEIQKQDTYRRHVSGCSICQDLITSTVPASFSLFNTDHLAFDAELGEVLDDALRRRRVHVPHDDLDGIAGYFRFDNFADPDSVTIDGIPEEDGPVSSIIGAEFQSTTGQLEEVQYSLGSGETISLDFDISGRIDTELIRTQRVSRSNRRSL